MRIGWDERVFLLGPSRFFSSALRLKAGSCAFLTREKEEEEEKRDTEVLMFLLFCLFECRVYDLSFFCFPPLRFLELSMKNSTRFEIDVGAKIKEASYTDWGHWFLE